MRSRLFLLLVAVWCAPAAASAAGEFTDLLRDLDALQKELDRDIAAQEELNEDLRYEEQPELFPRPDAGTELPREAGSVSDTHVYIRVEGIPYILEDVPIVAWFAPYVRSIADRGVITGYTDVDGRPNGRFGPADDVTMAQLAKIVATAAAVDMNRCALQPRNVSASGSWAAPFVACAEQLNWSVFRDPATDIARPATRAEVVATVLEAFGRETEVPTGRSFRDVSASFPLAGAIEAAAVDELIGGYTDESGQPTGVFGPFDRINRAATAKIVALAIDRYKLK